MIDIQLIRDNPETVKAKIADKNYNTAIVDRVLELDQEKRTLIQEVQRLNEESNKAAKERNIEEGKRLKSELKEVKPQLDEKALELEKVLNQIPNLAFDDVPVGKGEDANVQVRTWGTVPQFDFEAKSHLEIGQNLGILDFESGAKVAGSQFYYSKGDAVLLEFALLQLGLEILVKKGYIPVITPDLAKSRYYLGTGYQPKGDEAQIYEIEGEDLGLIATAEVTMAGLHADEVLEKAQLPKRYVAVSHCFRKEAGAYGKYSKGLYRVHQFTKLEMFAYTTPEESSLIHEEILSLEEELVQSLKIPYRVLEMCTGDLGAIAAKKYDLEAWMPGRGEYGEITSTSNTTDYQARNLNIKFRNGDHNEYVHLLNGTAYAISRMIIAILENYQQPDGSVAIPEALQKWMGKDKISH